ncbi:hypothetical protein BST61_g10292 [Cercospora zeina]
MFYISYASTKQQMDHKIAPRIARAVVIQPVQEVLLQLPKKTKGMMRNSTTPMYSVLFDPSIRLWRLRPLLSAPSGAAEETMALFINVLPLFDDSTMRSSRLVH